MKVLINNGVGYQDYTRYVVDGTLTVEDSINVPSLLNFVLTPTDNSFQIPKRSAYVRVVSEIYASGSYAGGYGSGGYGGGGYGGGFGGGGYGSGKVLATGFISNAPEVEFLGMTARQKQTAFQQVAYHINVTSDEWLLNCKALPYVPAFVGQTQGQILATLAQALLPGYFDVTSAVASGDIVPYFQYTPDQTWSDIAKTFGDASRYRVKVQDKKITFLPFGDQPLGVSYDETQPQRNFFPLQLTTNVVTVPPVNDAIVLGAIEPQTNWENYFIGDGLTANFSLLHNVFDGATALLLEDDWTETGFQTNMWFVNDPLNVFKVQGQGLQVVMSSLTGALNSEYVLGINGLELGGGLNVQHGEFLFVDRCVGGIVGGLYTGAPSGAYIGSVPAGGWPPGVYGSPGPGQQANCVAGFSVYGQASGATFTASGAQVFRAGPGLTAVTFEVPDSPALEALVPGMVLTPELFTASAFLNGQTMVFDHLTPLGGGVESVYCLTPNLGGSPYSGTDTGTLSVFPNTVVVSASGAGGVVIQPVFNGQLVGPQIITRMNHTYLLQTWIGATKWDRYQAIYRTLTGSGQYGGNFLTASGTVTWAVTDFDQGVFANTPAYLQNAVVPQINKFTLQEQALPSFVVYAPINAIGLNLVIQPNGTIIAQPPEGSLFVRALTGETEVGIQYDTTLITGGVNLINQPPTGAFNFQLPVLPQNLGPEFHYLMGFGQQNQTASIQTSGNVQQLAFYGNTIPGVGARIRHQSWASGQAIARIQDPIAIAAEAVTAGDNGYRTAVMSNLQPLPRTSAECALAGAAAIIDREYPQLQGTYTVESDPRKFENLFNPGTSDYPFTGRYFYINSAVRGVSGGIQNFITNTVRIQVVDLREELLNISIDYGPDLYLEKLLTVFNERTNSTTANLLTPQETAPPPNPIFLPLVGSTFLPTLDNAHIINIQNSAVTGNSVTVDLGSPPVTACEVRQVDTGWGVNDRNRVGLFTTQQFVLSRVLRDQTWYLRQLNGGQVSQFSKALRVVYPFIPSPPSFVSINSSTLQLGYNGFVSDIYGVEVRVPGLSGGPYQVSVPFNYNLPNTPTDSLGLLSRSTPATVFAPAVVQLEPNALALYGPTSYSLGLTTGVGGTGVTPQSMPQLRSQARIPNPINPIGGGQPNPPITPPAPPVTIPPPQVGFATLVPTQFFPGDIVLLVSPNDNSFEGLVVVSQASSGALFNGNWGFAWYDEQPSPRTVGGSSELVGQALLYRRGPSCPIVNINPASGTDVYGNRVTSVTLTSSQNVPFSVGDNVVVGIGYGTLGTIQTSVQPAASGWTNGIGTQWTNPTGFISNTAFASIATGPALADLYADTFGFNLPAGVVITQIHISFTYYLSQQGAQTGTAAIVGVGALVGNNIVSNFNTPFTLSLPFSFGGGGGRSIPPQTLRVFLDTGGADSSLFNSPDFAIIVQTKEFDNPITLYVQNCQVQLLTSNNEIVAASSSVPYIISQNIQSETTLYAQSVVTAIPTPESFSFNMLGSITAPSVTGASGGFIADGYAAQLPPGSTDGVMFQNPVFAPSDLRFDLTQPYVQAMLQIAQALSPSGRAPGLSAYFFNLTWDYSQPLVIPNVSVPSISGLTVNPDTQQLTWTILGGTPTGFRVEMLDPTTGITQFATTVDHAHNPQKITQYRLHPADFFNNRIIVVTPFDEQGDGTPFTIFNPAAPGGSTGQGTYSIGCTYNGLIPGGTTLVKVPLDQIIQFSQNFNGSQGNLDFAPTNTMVLSITKQLAGAPTASQAQVGVMTFAPGATVAAFASTGALYEIGDTLRVIAPSGTDPTGQNIGFVLSATKVLV
jgi:hypothetical protein